MQQLDMATPQISSELLTKAQFAALVGISVHTVEKWNARGMAPTRVRIGRKVFYRRADVIAWLDSLEARS